MPLASLIIIGIVALLAVIGATVFVFTRTELDRRAHFARFLVKGFIFLVAGSLLLGMALPLVR